MKADCISYQETGYFSQTVIDYLNDIPSLRSFYSHRPSLEGFAQFFEHKKVTANREVLVDVLTRQYESVAQIADTTATSQSLQTLLAENAFTVTTGHQLNIFAGPLYFIYKIAGAIKLSRQLKAAFPDKEFVPVYWMATEDHDFPEINHTTISDIKVEWKTNAAGATGRLDTRTIRQALNRYKGVLGVEGYGAELAEIVETAYTRFDKLADATRYLVHALFGQHGLVIVDADDHQLKKQFAPFIEHDIIGGHSFIEISKTDERLKAAGVHTQIHPREINFFYLTDTLRERIVFEDGRYNVLNTEISFSEVELKREIAQFPQRFSPNVSMRPLYQEIILPNAAYIGGGAEVVYWLQLKGVFDYYQIDYPILLLRNSALLIPRQEFTRIAHMQFKPREVFKPADELKKAWVAAHTEHNLNLTDDWLAMEYLFDQIKKRASRIDGTLVPSTSAVQARLKHAMDNLEKKMIRAEKRNYATRLAQIDQVKAALFPNNSLQERTENFGHYYVKWGQIFIDELINNFKPLEFQFSILSE